MSESAYEFDAPQYCAAEQIVQGSAVPPPRSPERVIVETTPKTNTPESIQNEKTISTEKVTERSPTVPRKSLKIESSSRQSPRLVAMSKALRRKNAARSSEENGSCKRNSSESTIATKLTTIGKKTNSMNKATIQKGLSNTSTRKLSEVAVFTKPLSAKKAKSSDHSGPTKTKTFKFATDARLGVKANPENNEDASEFPKLLRSSAVTRASARGPTRPQPFHLHENRTVQNPAQRFVSIAEMNLKFQTKTPERFRACKAQGPEVSNLKTRSKVTIPHTPKLTANKRSRPVDYPTMEEVEEKELEEIKKYKFKAQPLDKKILEAPILPVVAKKILTQPEPFGITDELKPLTKRSEGEQLEMYASTTSMASYTHRGIKKKTNCRNTVVKPFSFSDRDAETLRKKNEKIDKEIQDDLRLTEFHATPMPIADAGPKGLPPKQTKKPAKVAAFNLQSDIRGEQKQNIIKQQLEEEQQAADAKRHFVASESTSTHREPFVPEKPGRMLKDISDHELNTAKRGKDREAFNMQMKEKEYEILAVTKEREKLRQEEEELEVQKMRKEAQHKAKPVPVYKPFEVRHGLLPPTKPTTPHFATSKRTRARTATDDTFTKTA